MSYTFAGIPTPIPGPTNTPGVQPAPLPTPDARSIGRKIWEDVILGPPADPNKSFVENAFGVGPKFWENNTRDLTILLLGIGIIYISANAMLKGAS